MKLEKYIKEPAHVPHREKIKTTIYLNKKQYEEISNLRRDFNINTSAFIRDAIDEALERIRKK